MSADTLVAIMLKACHSQANFPIAAMQVHACMNITCTTDQPVEPKQVGHPLSMWCTRKYVTDVHLKGQEACFAHAMKTSWPKP